MWIAEVSHDATPGPVTADRIVAGTSTVTRDERPAAGPPVPGPASNLPG
jgi:hypothetical protein